MSLSSWRSSWRQRASGGAYNVFDSNTLSGSERAQRRADAERMAASQSNLDPNRQFMGQEYFTDEDTLTWREDAQQLWEKEHGIDPRTGGLTGPMGQVPAGIALKWQGIHDQAVWNARNRMAQDAFRYAQGATGLMSSYRSGGGAAIQSNVYGNLSNVRMNQAQMLQPLDLLGDYRRDQIARAGSAGRSESTVGTAIQGLGAVLSVIPGLNVVGMALSVGGGIVRGIGANKQAGAYAGANGAQQYGGQQGFGGFGQMGQQGQGGQGWNAQDNADLNNIVGNMDTAGGFNGSGGIGPPAPSASDLAGKEIQGTTGQGNFFGESAGGGQALRSQVQPDQAGQSGGQKQMAGQQTPIAPVVGADGSFAPASYAQHAAATAMEPNSMQLALSENIAGHISDDPSWSLITMKIDRELMLRTYGGAA